MDISELQHLRKTQQESEAQLRAIFEHAPVGIGKVTFDGHWCDVNQQLCGMLGYTREELLTRPFQEMTYPDDLKASLEHYHELLAGHCQSYALEQRYLRKDGSPLWVKMTGLLVGKPEGTCHHTVAIMEDISTWKQIEEERVRLSAGEQQARIHAEGIARRLRALQRLTDVALEHLPLEELLRELLDRIREALAVDSTSLLLLTEDGRSFTVRARSGLEEAVATPPRLPFGTGVVGRIVATREPVIMDEVSTAEGADPFLQGPLRSLLGVPLLVEEQVMGVLHAGTSQPHHFTQDDVWLLETVAYRIALAIDHAQVLQAEQHARREAAARASQLQAMIEAMTEGVSMYTPLGEPLLANTSDRKLLGIDDPDRLHLFSLLSYPERATLLQCRDQAGTPFPAERWPLTRALQGEVVTDAQSEDVIITALDGRKRQLSSTAAPIRDAEGQIAGAVIVCRDVTERRLLERRTHDALGALLEMAEVLVGPAAAAERRIGADAHTEISTVAQRLVELTARVLGYERVSIAAVDPETTQVVPLAVVSSSAEETQQWWASRRSTPRLNESPDPTLVERLYAGEVLLLERGGPVFGELHPFQLPRLLLAPMRVGKHLVGLLSIGHDCAGQGYAPEDIVLAGAVAHLTALVLEREHLLRQREKARANELAMRETNRHMEAFLGIASHELKTPLTTIQLHLQWAERRLQRATAQEDALPPGVAQELARLRQQLLETQVQWARLDRLVNDLLDVSCIQAGTLHLSLSPLDLGALVQGVVEEQRQIHPERQVEWSRPYAKPLPVLADAGRIHQVVQNYLCNAFKYAPEAAPITIGVGHEAALARVWVRDQGPGMTPDQQAHLWDRFYRAPGVEVRCGSRVGLGLGLYLCKTLIEQHQGHVGVESVAGQGATFWFTLPLAPVEEEGDVAELPGSSGLAAPLALRPGGSCWRAKSNRGSPP